MVILSAAICNPQGKSVLARQFTPISRLRIEGLLAAFPKLIDAEKGTKQHTFVETKDVRYVYQPMDGLWILIITDKNSNILEDLSTLRLLAKLIPEYCDGHDEESIAKKAFELCFAFDEVVSLGYREDVTLQQIKNFTAMDSHEEKLHNIIRESKEMEAKNEAKRKADLIMKQKKNEEKMAKLTGGNKFGGGGMQGGGVSPGMPGIGGFGGAGSGTGNELQNAQEEYTQQTQAPSRPRKAKKRPQGMRLGGLKAAGFSGLQKALAEEKSLFNSLGGSEDITAAVDEGPAQMAGPAEKVDIFIREGLSANFDREGGLKKFEVKGTLTVAVNDPDYGQIALKTSHGERAMSYSLNPKFNKKKWKTTNIITFKDKKNKFNIGASQARQILKWGFSSEDTSLIPITLTFWPEVGDDTSTLTVDYEIEREDVQLQNVVVNIPCPGNMMQPEADGDGNWSYSRQEKMLQWQIGNVGSGDSGAIEFIISSQEVDDFYPVSVDFEAEQTFSEMDVVAVMNVATKTPSEFNCTTTLVAENYFIS